VDGICTKRDIRKALALMLDSSEDKTQAIPVDAYRLVLEDSKIGHCGVAQRLALTPVGTTGNSLWDPPANELIWKDFGVANRS
jgi:hypothetical protein